MNFLMRWWRRLIARRKINQLSEAERGLLKALVLEGSMTEKQALSRFGVSLPELHRKIGFLVKKS